MTKKVRNLWEKFIKFGGKSSNISRNSSQNIETKSVNFVFFLQRTGPACLVYSCLKFHKDTSLFS